MGYGDVAIVWAGRILGVLLFLLLLAVVVGMAALLVPEAQVTLVPYREVVEVNLELRADPEAEKASLEDLIIPARIVEAEVEQTGEIATEGQQGRPRRPGHGRDHLYQPDGQRRSRFCPGPWSARRRARRSASGR